MNIELFKKRLIKKVPQIKNVEVVTPPKVYEAYLYKYDNSDNNKKYAGIHKGEIDDHYWNSSECPEFKKVYSNVKSNLKLSFFMYGDYEEMKTKEHELLTSVDAKNNPEWYNKHNGSPGKQKLRMDKCKDLAGRINSGEFNVVDKNGDYIKEPKEEVYDLHRIQAREELIIPELVKKIRERINDVHGSTDECTPILIYEDRLGDGVDVLGDGNNTIEAAYYEKSASEVPVARVPKEEHEHLSNLELDTIGGLLNPEPKIVKEPTKPADAAKHIVKVSVKNGLEYDCEENYDYMDEIGFTNAQIKRALKLAKDEIDKQNLLLANKSFIEYKESVARQQELKDTVEALGDKETFATSASTEYINLAKIMKLFRIAHQHNPKKRNIKVVGHHPQPSSVNKWPDEIKLHQKEIDYWILTHDDVDSFEFIIMEHLTDNKLVN
jgi:hypothetical protein